MTSLPNELPTEPAEPTEVQLAEVRRRLEGIYIRLGPKAAASLRIRGATREDADDAVHEAVLKMGPLLLRSPPSDPDPYFMTMVTNAWKDSRRKADNAKTQLSDSAFEDSEDLFAEEPFDQVIDAHDRRAEFAAVRAAVTRLPSRQRDVLIYSKVVGMTNAQIGEALGLEVGNVRYHLSVGRAHLKKLLAIDGVDGEEEGR
jgi:RNA polymerase sigma factor (sigma-70 family)